MPNLSKPMLQNLVRQAQRELAKTDVFAFGEYVFGYEPAEHHREMVDFAQFLLDHHQSGVVLAPRGSAKTGWMNTIWLTFLVATRPDIRIGLFSNTDKKAWAMSGAIRWLLSESEAFKEVFGDLRSPAKWTDAEWFSKNSVHTKSKDRTMVAAGVNPTAVSKRFDLIFCDDILDEENTGNIDRREKVETWFWKTLKPTLTPKGSIIVVGTRWTEGDLYEKLIETNKWPSFVKSAIVTDENGIEASYWPEWWPLERLYEERANVGADNFACMYLNDISGFREGTIFRREWWESEYFETLPEGRQYIRTMGVDLASSEKERADFTARAVIAEDNLHEHWILGIYQTKTDSGHREFVKDGYNAFPGISKIIIETNQHQSTLVQDLLRETNMPVVGKRTDTDKRTRARAVAARYESHRVHHHVSLRGSDYERQLTNFPKGHDDMIDAVGLAMDLGGLTGSVAAVGNPLFSTAPQIEGGSDVQFTTGREFVPAYLVHMLEGIDTARLTRQQAIDEANRRTSARYVSNAIAGMLRR
jgi:predicted phage terminase large subunit-like protein